MKSLRLLTIAVFAATTVPRLAHRGMFVDGVTYASIARNLAAGRGRFWTPFYTATIYPQFHEHPPLGFWLQSLWFRAIGDHLAVERLYTLAVAIATAWLLVIAWRLVVGRLDEVRTFTNAASHWLPIDQRREWLPVLMWIAVPVVSWAIVGNLLETTVAFFSTAAIVAVLLAFESPAGASVGWGALSGIAIVGAGLTKGPVGLFPLVAPLALAWGGAARVIRVTLAQWVAFGMCAVGLAAWPAARDSLTQYFDQQVVAALTGQREVSEHSMAILRELLQGVTLPIAGVALVAVVAAGQFEGPSRQRLVRALGLLGLGLAGTLPILLSAKQAGHYMAPAVPLYALAAALVMAPTAARAQARIEQKGWDRRLAMAAAAIALGTLVAAFVPGIGRDRARLADIDRLAAQVPAGETIGICPDANADWGLHAWFERRFQVSLDARNQPPHAWFLQTASSASGCTPSTCTAASDDRRQLVLMWCGAGK